MAHIDPEAIQLLGRGSSEKPGWLQKCSPRAPLNCPAHRGESGTPPVPELPAAHECAWPTAETPETELVKLGKEVESDFKFI